MTLRQKQSLFAGLVAKLILHAMAEGYEMTLGEGWRSEQEANRLAISGAGIRRSLHQDRLAQDLNLFKNGLWLTKSEDHRPIAEWWLRQHELCRWGGNFSHRPDGNHYSLAHEGRQ